MAKQTFSVGQVLTAAQMTNLQQTAMLGGAASAKTTSYTLVAADAGGAISMTSTSATTITVNTGLFAAGDTVQITNLGTGVCTITAGTATVNTSASLALAQYESGTLDFTSSSAAIFIKGAGAAAASGGMTLISTTTLAGTTTISSIPTTYNDLQIEIFRTKNSAGNYDLYCFPNNQSLATDFFSNRATTGTMTFVQDDYIRFTGTTTAMQNDQTNAWTLIIHNYASATAAKPFTISGGYYNNGKFVIMTTGLIRDTSAITSLVIGGAGSSNSGTVLLYGVK